MGLRPTHRDENRVEPEARGDFRRSCRPTGERRAKPACCRGASPYRKGSSESILTPGLAGDIVRCHSKRRQGHWWAGLSSFEKAEDQDADSLPSWRKAIRQPRYTRVVVRSCVV